MTSDAFIPVHQEEQTSWYPSNRAAELLVHTRHIWSDIEIVNEIRLEQREKSEVRDRLLFKYIIIEFVSLLDPLRELQEIVFKADRLVKGQNPPSRYVTKRELVEAKDRFKEFWRSVEPVRKNLTDVRNKIGAHRSEICVSSTHELWNKLNAEQYLSAVNAFHPLFDFLKGLNLYNWSRSLSKGRFSLFGCLIVHNWDDAFESGETI